jgi:hypothetical protein
MGPRRACIFAFDQDHIAGDEGNDGYDDHTANEFDPPGLQEYQNGVGGGVHD